MDWKQEAKEILEFHEQKQKQYGKGKQGRPESISGKKGWSIRDTAGANNISYKHAYDLLVWGWKLRQDPKFENKVTITLNKSTAKKHLLENLIGTVKTTIFILKKDKRTIKIASDLERALKDYES